MGLPPAPTPLGRAQPDNARLESRFRFGSAGKAKLGRRKKMGTVLDVAALGL
jgi:hypothetical protein